MALSNTAVPKNGIENFLGRLVVGKPPNEY